MGISGIAGTGLVDQRPCIAASGTRSLWLALCLVACPLTASAEREIYFSPRIVGYFDNTTSLDSSVSADPGSALSLVDALNDVLGELLGPSALLSIASADGSVKGEQAAYKMAGASVEFVWDDNHLILTALAGDAQVRTDLLFRTVVDFEFAGLHSQDLWTSREINRAEAKRADLEVSFEHGVTENLGFIAGARYERVKFDYVGEQQTLISQNLTNTIGSLIGEPSLFTLGMLEGTSRGTVEPELYSVRLGGVARTQYARDEIHRLYASVQLHATYVPSVSGRATATPDDPSLDPVTFVGETEQQWSVGPDIVVGYDYRLTDKIRFISRYRATAYFPVSGEHQTDDPRVNHGFHLGLSIDLRN